MTARAGHEQRRNGEPKNRPSSPQLDSTPKRTDWFWLGWLLAFLVVEIPAAIRKHGGTFSEFCWRVFRVTRQPFRGSWRRWPLVFCAGDLCLHLGWTHSAYPLMVSGAMVGGIIVWWFVRERSSFIVALLLFASPAVAQEQLKALGEFYGKVGITEEAPTFLDAYLWKQVLWEGTPRADGTMGLTRSEPWGGRLVGGIGFHRLGFEGRLDVSGLKDQFSAQDPATYQSLEAYGMVHLVAANPAGLLQLGPAAMVGSISSFKEGASYRGFGADVVAVGGRLAVKGSELEMFGARTSFLRGDPSYRFLAVAHVRITAQMALVADLVSGQAGFVRLGFAVKAF